MTGSLPRADAIFDTSTSAEFTELVDTSTYCESQIQSLRDMVSSVLNDDCIKPETFNLAGIGLEHLSTLMFGQFSFLIAQNSHHANM
jgi:hypothetical protein